MIPTRKRLLVDVFLTRRLSKSLAFCEFASVNFEPWAGLFIAYFWDHSSCCFINVLNILSKFKFCSPQMIVLQISGLFHLSISTWKS